MSWPFFYLHYSDGPAGVAYAPRQVVSDALDDFRDASACPFTFGLSRGPACDFLATDIGWRLFSPAAASILQTGRTPRVSWLRVNVEIMSNSQTTYFAPIFLEAVEVICREESILVEEDFVVKAVLDPEKVNGLDFFPVARDDERLVVSRRLKEQLEQSGMSNFEFSPLPMRRILYGKAYH